MQKELLMVLKIGFSFLLCDFGLKFDLVMFLTGFMRFTLMHINLSLPPESLCLCLACHLQRNKLML